MKFTFIGMTDEAAPRFTDEARAAIEAGGVFSGGARHRAIVSHLLPEGARWIEITPRLYEVFREYEGLDEVVVFASGDPLFFGFAATVGRRLPGAEIVVYPAPNSLQTLAHRLGMPYGGMRAVSLTGRPWAELDRALIEGSPMIGILTDRTHTPAAIARRMAEFGYTGYRVTVGERLGGANERVSSMSLDEAGARNFDMPNCVIVHGTPRRPRMGIPDAEFEPLDGRTRMITKMPVRLAALAALDLEIARTFWDVGFCTGSVSVEARLRFPHLAVHSFEVRPECARLMEVNSRRHGAPGIEAHIGDFLALDLTALPAPDAVFIGGHGGRIEEVVARAAERLTAGGAVVFNSVSEDSRTRFEASCAASSLTLAARMRVAVDDHNPIEIFKAIK